MKVWSVFLSSLIRKLDYWSIRIIEIGDKDPFLFQRYIIEELIPSLEMLCMEVRTFGLYERVKVIKSRLINDRIEK